MSTATVAGLLLIVVPIAFNVAFGALAARFDYPDILRQPTAHVLSKFRDWRNRAGADLVGLCANGPADGSARRAARPGHR